MKKLQKITVTQAIGNGIILKTLSELHKNPFRDRLMIFRQYNTETINCINLQQLYDYLNEYFTGLVADVTLEQTKGINQIRVIFTPIKKC